MESRTAATWQLRPDLEVMRAEAQFGRPAVLIHDPVSGDFDRVEWPEADLIDLLRKPISIENLTARFSEINTQKPTRNDVASYLAELGQRGWLRGGFFWPNRPKAKRRMGLVAFLARILFVQIPLIRPEFFLRATAWLARLFINPLTATALIACGMAGLYLSLPRWEDYWRDSLGDFNLAKAPAFMAALIFVKLMHEFSHAYVATLSGARVSSMGVAFFFFMPLPFTDVTDAWRLPWSSRLKVAAAGMLAEMAVAGLSLLLWALSPPGEAAQALARLSSVAVASTLLTNLNPGPRFDGYYILVCLTRLENLRARAMAELRRVLWRAFFGIDIPSMEQGVPRGKRRAMLTYAVYAIFYRLSLGVGLALMAYHMLPKVIGLPLAAAELWLFFGHPVIVEAVLLRRSMGKMRLTLLFVAFLLVVSGLGVWFVGEWPRRVHFPAVTRAATEEAVRTMRSGVTTEVAAKRGERVDAGQVLAVLESPMDEPLRRRAEWALAEAEISLEQAWRGEQSRRETGWMTAEVNRRRVELDAMNQRSDYLTVKSPAAGVLASWERSLEPGVPVARGRLLGWVVDDPVTSLSCYAPMEMAGRLEVGKEVKFFPDSGEECIIGSITRIDSSRPEMLEDAQLAAVLGAIRVANGAYALPRPYAKVAIRLQAGAVRVGQTGRVWVWTSPESMLERSWQWLRSLAVRESAF